MTRPDFIKNFIAAVLSPLITSFRTKPEIYRLEEELDMAEEALYRYRQRTGLIPGVHVVCQRKRLLKHDDGRRFGVIQPYNTGLWCVSGRVPVMIYRKDQSVIGREPPYSETWRIGDLTIISKENEA